ncbi:MAG: hypothetical protein U9P14_12705 [Gemmatimonadota bacterium]|nr:hypothetical protein [Gemmatimonadota bacterium]
MFFSRNIFGQACLLFAVCFLLVFASSSPGQMDRNIKGWQRLGPGGGGSHFVCTVSPHDPDFVFSRCDMTGAQVTYNGGRTWRMFNLRTVIDDFEFDPNDPNTVYASNTGLYRSENRGETWRLIYPDPKNIVAEHMVGDHSDQGFETVDGMPGGHITQVRVDPADSRHLFIGLAPPRRLNEPGPPVIKGNSVRVLVSKDRGASWRVLAEVTGKQVLALFPGSWDGVPGQVTVITDQACAKISGKNGEVESMALPVEKVRAADGGKNPRGSVIYILADMWQEREGAVRGGIYRSRDAGRTWEQVNSGLLEDWPITAKLPFFKTLACCESRPCVVYLSEHFYYDEIPVPSSCLRTKEERKFGTFKTENAGDSWRWVYRASMDSLYSQNFKGGWENESYGPEWGESPHSFGVYPADPDICYVTDNRTYRTLNGGRTWEQIYTDSHPDGSWSSRGIDVTTTYGVKFDPFDKDHMFILYTDIGLWNSFNGGKSWFHAIKGVPRQWINTTYELVFDPEIKGRIYTARSNCHDLPRPKMWRDNRLEQHKRQGGVAISEDGGLSWRPSIMGIPPNTVCTHIVLDPTSPASSRTLYVCGINRGVYKSSDGGASWRTANTGLPFECNAWRIVRLPSGRLILLVARGLRDRQVVNGALYYSDDGAATWQPASMPEGVTAPNDLECDPSDPDRMYLSCWPWIKDGREHCGGLYRTEDGGATWKRVFNEQAHVWAAAVDPHNPSTVYINTYDSAAYRSDDRGNSWYRLKGYNFKWGHRPVPDPHNPGMLYLTTFGGSVFYGPATGETGRAFDDIQDGDSFLLRW